MSDNITVLEIARVEMNRAVWGFLNHILPPVYHDDDIDAARDAFIVGGLDALARHLEGSGDTAGQLIVDEHLMQPVNDRYADALARHSGSLS